MIGSQIELLMHFSLSFPLPDRIKKQRMDFWYDRSKYNLMCFSFTWSHSLLKSVLRNALTESFP